MKKSAQVAGLILPVAFFFYNSECSTKSAFHSPKQQNTTSDRADTSRLPFQSGTIDITGNWHEGEKFLQGIQTTEPAIEKEDRLFTQTLDLLPGHYSLTFEYDEKYENLRGNSIHGKYGKFKGLKIDNAIHPVTFLRDMKDNLLFTGQCEFTVAGNQQGTKLELSLGNTRVFRTWLSGKVRWRTSDRYKAIAPFENGEFLIIHGLPFLARKIDIRHYEAYISHPDKLETDDRGSIAAWNKNGISLKCQGAKLQSAHFLGMIHQIDIANGSWYSPKGDDGYSHFVGDRGGEIVIRYEQGDSAIIPLVFGYNLWYGRPWDMIWNYAPYGPTDQPLGINCDSAVFYGHPEYRDLICDALALSDGMRLMGSKSNNTRFVFSVDLQGRAVNSISIRGEKGMYGNPLISAITLECNSTCKGLGDLPEVSTESPNLKVIPVDAISMEKIMPPVEKIMHTLYTFQDQLPKLTEPEIPAGYFGPRYNFTGPQEAMYAASYLYYNGHECAAYIGDRGNGPSSCTARWATFHYIFGIGITRRIQPLYGSMGNYLKLYQEKQPGQLGGIGSAWSRGIGELMRETMAVGFGKFIQPYTNWLDSCLYVDSYPPHWSRVPGMYYYGKERTVGNIVEKGNRENDGHGICMWGRYMVWHWLGHPATWNKEHWLATKASVDWIQWQLDTDTLFPGSRKDVLYTESECAHGDYDIYSSCNCLHGIRLAIMMAQQLNKHEEVKKWTLLYKRLQKGILQYLVDTSEFGPIWHTDPGCDWQDHAHKLVHLQLASDGITYTPLEDYRTSGDLTEREYLKIDLNTYRYLMRDKNYNCLRMFGYGQGMMIQSALLLDQMEDARQFINTMVDHTIQPNLEGWAGPEGIILHKSGLYYVPVNGYMGQDSHVADGHKALRLMLGIDDNQADHLRLVPRYPVGWNSIAIQDYPVLTGNERQHIAYTYEKKNDLQSFSFALDHPVEVVDIRLGPVPEGKKAKMVSCNGKDIPFETLHSGDSQWVWVRDLREIKKGEILLYLSDN
jgi:hypothetical protein